MLKLNKQLAGFLVAIVALVSLGMTTVQASNMNMMMTSMSAGMEQSMPGKCNDCGKPDGSKDMIGCNLGGCVAPLLAFTPLIDAPGLSAAAALDPAAMLALSGNALAPEPYPPRTIHMS